jgi:hypothetical protein
MRNSEDVMVHFGPKTYTPEIVIREMPPIQLVNRKGYCPKVPLSTVQLVSGDLDPFDKLHIDAGSPDVAQMGRLVLTFGHCKPNLSKNYPTVGRGRW